MSIVISDLGYNAGLDVFQAEFKFQNSGPSASSITDIYFEDGTLLGIADIDDSLPGVDFDAGASPPNLPGGNALDPDFGPATATTYFGSIDSESPAQPNGVNPGEWVSIVFNLVSETLSGGSRLYKTFFDVYDALIAGTDAANFDGVDDPDTLRIGVHVQGFADGGSESFVFTDPSGPQPTIVPEPASLAVWLLLLGTTGGLWFTSRRRKR